MNLSECPILLVSIYKFIIIEVVVVIVLSSLKILVLISKMAEEKIEEKCVQIQKWNVHYVIVGSGPHVVLCMPGTLGSMYQYRQQIQGFDRDNFTLVAWDPPGFGASRPPERVFNLDFYEEYADEAYLLMKELNYSRYSLLGWCGGGRASIILAAKHPEAVDTLVVWSTNAFILPKELATIMNYREISTWPKRNRDPMIEIYGEDLLSKYWSSWIDSMSEICEKRDGHICTRYLQSITCPTFILYGGEDVVIDSSHASFLHQHIQGSTLYQKPDGKHELHIQHATEFNDVVREFLLQNLK